MQTARVIGTVVATQKDFRMEGVRLMVIQPVDSDGNKLGTPIVAGDAVGSGIGDMVIWAKSKEGAFAMPNKKACCDAGITGIIDSIYTEDKGYRLIENDYR